MPVRDLLDGLCAVAQVRPQVEIDPALFRPDENRPSYDTARIHAHVGWEPEIPLRQTLEAVYADILARRRAGA